MVIIEAVFREELPVGADVVILHALDHLHLAGRRLVHDEIDVFLRACEVVLQRYRIRVEVEEDEAAIGCDVRRLLEPEIALPEARRKSIRAGHAVELAVAVVAPAVIEAGVVLRITFRLAAHGSAAVAAGVEEDANPALAVAAEDNGTLADDAGLEIPRLPQLRLVADVDPADVEDTPPLELEYPRIHHRRAVDLKALGFRVVDDPALIVHLRES